MKSCHDTTLKIKVFGIVREKLKSDTLNIPINNDSISLEEIKKYLKEFYPCLSKNEINFVFAVNKVIRSENVNVTSSDEIALIPPISGG
ncbi:MAG TPA: MoaD/ThiS family protein [Nitrososphaeraceae archaeon]